MRGALHPVGTEQVVFIAAGAVGAAKAADQQHGDAHCDQDGGQACVHREPMDQVMHILETHTFYEKFRLHRDHRSI